MRNTIAAALFAALSTSVAMPAFAEVANDDQTLALAGLLDNNSFDRAQLMVANQIQFWQPVFDTLLVMDPDASIHPNLATEFSYNDDNSVLTLKLRDGVQFTDGTPFNADAVKANIEYLRDGKGQNSFMAASIETVEVVSPLEVKLHLGEPDPGLLEYLTLVGGAMASPATLGSEDSATNPVGSGPYVYDLQNSVAGRQYVYNRNPDYWNKDAFPFERITITPITDQVARLNALKSGQVDAGLGEARTIADAEANGLVVNKNDVNWVGLTLADREGKLVPALADVRVRQAINMAFDEASILKFVELGHGRVTDQTFPDTSEAYDPALDDYYSYDPEGARKLLAEAGYPDGFTMTMPDIGSFANVNPIVEQQLKAIGITVEWARIAAGTTIPELRSGKYPAFVFQFGSQGAWVDFRKFAWPTSPFNVTKVEDQTLIDMLKEAQHATGEQQKELFRNINRYYVEQAFFAPWYRKDTIYLTNAETTVEMQAGNAVPFIRNFGQTD